MNTASIDQPDELTAEELAVVRSFLRLAKRWPRSLTLASMGGTLVIVHTDDPVWQGRDGQSERAEAILASVGADMIPNTGGDW